MKPSDWMKFRFRNKRLNNIVKYGLKLDERLELITKLCEGRIIPPLDWITQIFSLHDSLLRELKFAVSEDVRDKVEEGLTLLKNELIEASRPFLAGHISPTNILHALIVCRKNLNSLVYHFLEELDERLREEEERLSSDILYRLIGIEKRPKKKTEEEVLKVV